MTKQQLSEALAIAQDKSVRFIDDTGHHIEDISLFEGYGLWNFQPVYCTIKQVAALIRCQCVRMNGTIDSDELNTLAKIGRQKFNVL